MAQDGDVFIAIGELSATVAPEDSALPANVFGGGIGEPGDISVPNVVT